MNQSTPTKTVCHPAAVSPKSKESICVHCLEIVSNPDYRRNLFSNSKSEKTKACVNLEIVVGATINPESCITAIVCRNCERRNDSLVKILESRELFYSSESKLVAESGFVKSTKRQRNVKRGLSLIVKLPTP